jgi:hypothetical protein
MNEAATFSLSPYPYDYHIPSSDGMVSKKK